MWKKLAFASGFFVLVYQDLGWPYRAQDESMIPTINVSKNELENWK